VNKPNRVFITDCEGPVTKNDNAAELAEAFIPNGAAFFGKISLYDDYLAEVVKKPGYKAGDTLKLILPFFKAFGLDDYSMRKFSRRNIEIIPKADTVLREISEALPAFIVSTSYSPYILAVCDAIGFPFMNTFSTAVSLDEYALSGPEKNRLRELHAEILDLPNFTIPESAASKDDLSAQDFAVVKEMDRIFWEILPGLEIYKIIEQVNPVGGAEKAAAIRTIVQQEESELRDVLYVGDSITDVAAFRLVKQAGGTALSFNGNDWAVREASFAITARNALPIGWIAKMFAEDGAEALNDLSMSEIKPELIKEISVRSCTVRKTVRTEKIGALG
jgi:energy-converting hydrogenase A subunit R